MADVVSAPEGTQAYGEIVVVGGAAEVLVGTVSHCHGALSVLELAAP
jgi:hypothetical protein